MRRLLGEIRKLDEEYGLIQAGETIAVGVSGGKDSLALLMLLQRYRDFSPRPFALRALTVSLSPAFDTAAIAALCEKWGVPCRVEETRLLDTVLRSPHPCALCARLRRGILLRMAAEAGAQKLALGHHRDDVLETWLMSALNEGRFRRLPPVAPMERAGLAVIRPLWNAREEAVADLARRYGLPVVKNPCPADGHTRRAEIRAHLDALEKAEPGAKECLWAALKRE